LKVRKILFKSIKIPFKSIKIRSNRLNSIKKLFKSIQIYDSTHDLRCSNAVSTVSTQLPTALAKQSAGTGQGLWSKPGDGCWLNMFKDPKNERETKCHWGNYFGDF
jgi:hypothetical protein